MQLPTFRFTFVLVASIAALDVFFLSVKPTASDHQTALDSKVVAADLISQTKVCDPYLASAGYVDSVTGVFIPINISENDFDDSFSSCSIAGFDHYDSLLKAAADPERLTRNGTLLPSHLANKIMLLYGDSFERCIADWLCEAAGIEPMIAKLNGSFVTAEEAIASDSRICSITSGSAVFSIVSVFHFGVAERLPDYAWGGEHFDPRYSPYSTQERIAWIPHFMRAVASRAFPQICELAGEICPDPVDKVGNNENAILADSIPPLLTDGEFWFPKPDLIVAQSTLWTIAHSEVPDVFGDVVNFLKFWLSKFKKNTLDTMYTSFGKYVKNHRVNETGEIIHRFYTRTIPLPDCPPEKCTHSIFYTASFSVINWMNRIIRSGMFGKTKVNGVEEDAWGVLDWEELVAHVEIHEVDTFHPGHKAVRVYSQLLFTRLQILHEFEN